MIFPAGDRPINARLPWVTWLLVASNTLIFVFTSPHLGNEAFVSRWGLLPARPTAVTFLSYQFLHGGVEHLVFNMLFLWFFGCNTERRLGPWLYGTLYLLLGVIAGASFLPLADPDVPLVGASGSTCGLMGLYGVLFPRRQIRMVYWVIATGTFRVAAFWFVLVYLGFQIVLAFWLTGLDPVAYWAHIGGAAAAILILAPLAGVAGHLFYPITEGEEEPAYEESYAEFDYVPSRPALEPAAEEPAPRSVETRVFGAASRAAFALIPESFRPMTPELRSELGGDLEARPHCLLTAEEYAEAVRLQRALRERGIRALIYPGREVLGDPTVIRVRSLEAREGRLVAIDEFEQLHTRGGGDFSIATAARVGDEVRIDLVARKPISTMRWGGPLAEALVLAPAVARVLRGVPVTRSFQEPAAEGKPPHRAFADEATYHDYVLWAVQLVLTPTYRTKYQVPSTK
jgi:membrane associated rhomboid family serine protease